MEPNQYGSVGFVIFTTDFVYAVKTFQRSTRNFQYRGREVKVSIGVRPNARWKIRPDETNKQNREGGPRFPRFLEYGRN